MLPVAAMAAAPGEGFEVVRYAVSLRPDLATAALSGSQQIVLRSTDDGVQRLLFSPNALRIRDAALDGQPVAVTRSPEAIAFELPRPLARGEAARLSFELSGVPARGLVRTGSGLYSSYFACDWMVCLQDRPGDKAHFSLDLFLPAGTASLGPGRALPRQQVPGGLVLHRWRSNRPYSAYLFGFAAGDFPSVTARTREGEFVYLDATGEGGDLAGAFAQTPSIARFLAGKAGVPLPGRRYTQLRVPGREAQEVATFSLIGLEALRDEQGEPESAWVIAHEMAHQWWGNLVTCRTWQDLWLNEGIATFMVAAWKEQAFGAEGYRQELAGAQRRRERAREAGFDKPLAWPGSYPSLGTRRAIQYGKGALFLHHLRTLLGERAFWSGLRGFTRRHAGGTVSSRDFQVAMERASGRDLAGVFEEWVYGPGNAGSAPK